MSEAMKRLQDLGQDFDAQDAIQSLTAKLERAKEGLEDAVAFMKGDISGEAQRLGIIAECEQALKDIEND